jgi:hypothetical protein
MNLTRLFSPQTALLLVLAGSLLGASLAAAPVLDAPAQDPPTLIEHLRAEINSRDALRQEYALMDVIMLSQCEASCTVDFFSIPDKMLRVDNESGVGKIMDLDALIPDLMKAYRTSPVGGHDGHRLLALSALINIGNAASLEQLVADSRDPSSRQSDWVNKNTQKSLVGFYLAKYPELTERVTRYNTFSIQDVRRAEGVRVKLAKKEAKATAGN